jgi:general secretion pathway protein G
MIKVKNSLANIGLPVNAAAKRRQFGLTVLEIMLALAIGAVLLAVAVPSYQAYITRARNAQAMADVGEMSTLIVRFYNDNNGQVPDSLADLGLDGKRDPWDRPYEFMNLTTMKGKGKARKDKNLVPINSDFDLYSKGEDGASAAPLTAKASRDDIIRGNNGRFIGLAEDH